MADIQPFRLRDLAFLILLSALWGASFLFIKLAIKDIPPLTLVAFRLLLAAMILGFFVAISGKKLPKTLETWRHFAVLAFIGIALPFFLISWGELYIDSSLAAILMSVMPLATILLAHRFTGDEPLTSKKLLGFLLGFAGVVILVGPSAVSGLGDEVAAQLALAAAALCYACNAVYVRASGVSSVPASVLSAGVLLTAAAMVLPFALLLDQPWNLNPARSAWWAFLALTLFSTCLAYMILFHLLHRRGASFTSYLNYLVPLFGVAFGAIFLEEELKLQYLLALLLVLSGVAVANSNWNLRRRRRV